MKIPIDKSTVMRTFQQNSTLYPVSPASPLVETENLTGSPQSNLEKSPLEKSPLNMPLFRQTITASFKMRRVDVAIDDNSMSEINPGTEVVNIRKADKTIQRGLPIGGKAVKFEE